jgi:hypothetical protein
MKELKFCYEKNLSLVDKQKLQGRSTLKAVWQKSKYWNKGQVIRIYFINGTIDERAEMKRAWSEIASYTKISFIYTTVREESDIRISFNKGRGSYSYLGTDALFIPKTMETINIGWRGIDVCRHEALHAIGALHEHQNPNEGIEWDREAVIRDLSGAPNYWSIEEIEFNVLNKIDKATVDASTYDPESVMLYYFPASWTKNGISSNDNNDFSDTDIEFMKNIYNVTEKDTIAPVLTLNGESHEVIETGSSWIDKGASAVDNKDGDITHKIEMSGDVNPSQEGLYHITYSVEDEAGNKTEKIRTIMVQTKLELKVFLKDLFPTKWRLFQLIEPQVVYIAQSLDIEASVDDLKADTVEKVWTELNK